MCFLMAASPPRRHDFKTIAELHGFRERAQAHLLENSDS
jgi:hypothetical protein